jgi:hypothetical protein
LAAILRAFLPALLLLLKLGKHKQRVLWHLADSGTPALGAVVTSVRSKKLGAITLSR